jgi:hypothetical protein
MKQIALALSIFLLATAACRKSEPSRWEKPADTVAEKPVVAVEPAKPVVQGGSLNKFFPSENEGGKKRRFTTEKAGFVEAKLEADGKEAATLTITDTNGAGDAAKFDKATEKLGEYPLLTPTKMQTSILVGKRFQVKVSSPSLSPDERKVWLQKFDLKGLQIFSPTEK